MLTFTPLISVQTATKFKNRYNLHRQYRLNDRRNKYLYLIFLNIFVFVYLFL